MPLFRNKHLNTVVRHLGLPFSCSVVQDTLQSKKASAIELATNFETLSRTWRKMGNRQQHHSDVIQNMVLEQTGLPQYKADYKAELKAFANLLVAFPGKFKEDELDVVVLNKAKLLVKKGWQPAHMIQPVNEPIDIGSDEAQQQEDKVMSQEVPEEYQQLYIAAHEQKIRVPQANSSTETPITIKEINEEIGYETLIHLDSYPWSRYLANLQPLMRTDAPARNKIIGELAKSYQKDFGTDALYCIRSNMGKFARIGAAEENLIQRGAEKKNIDVKPTFAEDSSSISSSSEEEEEESVSLEPTVGLAYYQGLEVPELKDQLIYAMTALKSKLPRAQAAKFFAESLEQLRLVVPAPTQPVSILGKRPTVADKAPEEQPVVKRVKFEEQEELKVEKVVVQETIAKEELYIQISPPSFGNRQLEDVSYSSLASSPSNVASIASTPTESEHNSQPNQEQQSAQLQEKLEQVFVKQENEQAAADEEPKIEAKEDAQMEEAKIELIEEKPAAVADKSFEMPKPKEDLEMLFGKEQQKEDSSKIEESDIQQISKVVDPEIAGKSCFEKFTPPYVGALIFKIGTCTFKLDTMLGWDAKEELQLIPKYKRDYIHNFLTETRKRIEDKTFAQQPHAWPFHYEKLYRAFNDKPFEPDQKKDTMIDSDEHSISSYYRVPAYRYDIPLMPVSKRKRTFEFKELGNKEWQDIDWRFGLGMWFNDTIISAFADEYNFWQCERNMAFSFNMTVHAVQSVLELPSLELRKAYKMLRRHFEFRESRFLTLPYCAGGAHWILVSYCYDTNSLFVFDSLYKYKGVDAAVNRLIDGVIKPYIYLRTDFSLKQAPAADAVYDGDHLPSGKALARFESLQIYDVACGIQTNKSDCGPLVCRFMALLSEGLVPSFYRRNLDCKQAGISNVTVQAIDDIKQTFNAKELAKNDFSWAPLARSESEHLRNMVKTVLISKFGDTQHFANGTRGRIAEAARLFTEAQQEKEEVKKGMEQSLATPQGPTPQGNEDADMTEHEAEEEEEKPKKKNKTPKKAGPVDTAEYLAQEDSEDEPDIDAEKVDKDTAEAIAVFVAESLALYFQEKNYVAMSSINMQASRVLTMVELVNRFWPKFFTWVKLSNDDTLLCNNIRPNYGNLKWAAINGKVLAACAVGKPQKIQRKQKLTEDEIEQLRIKDGATAKLTRPAPPKPNSKAGSKPGSVAKAGVTPQ